MADERDQHGWVTGQLGRDGADVQRQENEHQLLHQLRGWFGQAGAAPGPGQRQQADDGLSRPRVQRITVLAGPAEKRCSAEVERRDAAHPGRVTTAMARRTAGSRIARSYNASRRKALTEAQADRPGVTAGIGQSGHACPKAAECGAGAGTGPVRSEGLYAERGGYHGPRPAGSG